MRLQQHESNSMKVAPTTKDVFERLGVSFLTKLACTSISALIMNLDPKDHAILDVLQTRARLSMVELGKRVDLSHAAVADRVRRLEETGVIRGYRAQVDPKRLGFGIRALVRMGCVEWDRVAALIDQSPEVTDAFNVTGEDSWVLLIAVRDVEHLDAVLSRFSEVGEPNTSIVLRAPRERGALRTPGTSTQTSPGLSGPVAP